MFGCSCSQCFPRVVCVRCSRTILKCSRKWHVQGCAGPAAAIGRVLSVGRACDMRRTLPLPNGSCYASGSCPLLATGVRSVRRFQLTTNGPQCFLSACLMLPHMLSVALSYNALDDGLHLRIMRRAASWHAHRPKCGEAGRIKKWKRSDTN